MEEAQLNMLARAILPELYAFYDVPENQQAFEEWRKKRGD